MNCRTALAIALSLSALACRAQTVALSGTVVNSTGKGIFGVEVALSGAGLSTYTKTDGSWSIAGELTTAVSERNSVAIPSTNHLVLSRGRLALRYASADLLGRPVASSAVRTSGMSAAREASATVDTLLFSWKDSVRARKPIVTYQQTGIVTILDTSSAAVVVVSDTSGTLTDERDGQTYKWVKIGTQKWMAQNLNHRMDNDSNWCYSNANDSCVRYGRLYQWAAAQNVDCTKYGRTSLGGADTLSRQGACPSGWRLPASSDFEQLIAFLGSDNAGTLLKATTWATPGTDAYGFTGLPAGQRGTNGVFEQVGAFGDFWTTTELGATTAHNFYLSNGYTGVLDYTSDKAQAFSIRCLKAN